MLKRIDEMEATIRYVRNLYELLSMQVQADREKAESERAAAAAVQRGVSPQGDTVSYRVTAAVSNRAREVHREDRKDDVHRETATAELTLPAGDIAPLTEVDLQELLASITRSL